MVSLEETLERIIYFRMRIYTIKFLKNTGYFVRIKITNVGKFRQFPLMSKYNDNGVRMFSNEMVNEIVYIDKTALEDAINFQLIDFEIIDGYYFDQGRNDKINETIRHLYDLRKKLKKRKESSTNGN